MWCVGKKENAGGREGPYSSRIPEVEVKEG